MKHQSAYEAALQEAHRLYDDASPEVLQATLTSIREMLKHTFPSHKLVASAEVIYELLQGR
jgi:Flp pilus assembly CpaF family ATPase